MGDAAGVLPVKTCTALDGDGAAQPLAHAKTTIQISAHKPR